MIASFHEEAYSICICGLAMPSSATRKPKYQFHQIYNFLKEIYDILWKIFRYDIFVRVGCVGSWSSERSEQVRFLIQTHERKILSYKIFPYQRKKYFQVNSQNRPVVNLPVFNFRSQPQKMSLSNHWMSKFRFFLFEFWFSSPSPEKPTCQQLNGDIKYKRKTIVSFHARCYGFSQGRKSFYNTAV